LVLESSHVYIIYFVFCLPREYYLIKCICFRFFCLLPPCTGKSFTRKEHFTNHIMWHTGETPHRCDFCSKTFTRKEHLLNHVRQHTGESPHRCGFCSKSFTRKEHLVNHIRQHTGESGWQMFTSRATDIIVISIKSSYIFVVYLYKVYGRTRQINLFFFLFFRIRESIKHCESSRIIIITQRI